jgi:hypothetical protein
MGTDTDTKNSKPSEIKPLEEINPDDSSEPDSDATADNPAEKPDAQNSDDGEVSENINTDDEPVDENESSEDTEPSASEPEKKAMENDTENDFVALTDDDVEDSADNASPKENLSIGSDNKQKDLESPVLDEAKKSDKKEITPLKSTTDSQKEKVVVKGSATTRMLIAAAVIILIIAGYIILNHPALIGFKGEQEPPPAVQTETRQSAETVKVQVRKPESNGKHQLFLSKLNEVDRLREKLLAKKEEIYRLKLHYRNGIVDLKDQIGREMQGANISSLAQALKNKRIELNLRTIQRRQNYIRELEKPNRWAHNGSEELLFLKRKAELDLQMADVASGIDLDRHMRYINSAIQKYQPSAEKLAVDPLPVELTPLESLWDQIIQQQAGKGPTPIEPEDEKIIAEICSGDFKRIAELSAITTEAARCLSRMNGSDLFLNGLTQVSPEDAKFLFQWQGNWICLNSIKELSPAVARYLFRWNGNWISLNGLTEFPPELAVYLMEWKGDQLELMGLKYEKSKPDRKALKYLALWETMGGKLFVSDGVRKEMDRVM